MIISRVYKPPTDEIIYHYCDSQAFHSICTNKKFWFNDLFSMNDFLEVHWGYEIWVKAANRLFDEFGKDFLDTIDKMLHSSGFRGLVLASSFSLDGDVLSQWRAYSEDGMGYAIGFDSQSLLKLPVRGLRVLYNEEQQITEAIATIKTLHKMSNAKDKIFNKMVFVFGYDLTAFKNPAFSEEKEVRLIHLLDFEKSNAGLKLVDAGGTYFGVEKIGEEVKYRIKKSIPTPYIELDFTNDRKINPIKEVIIGPKNDIMQTAISIYLETLGLGSVKIKRSKVPYR